MLDLKVDTQALALSLKGRASNDLLKASSVGEVYIMFSLRCNLRCKVCSWWGIHGPCRKKGFLNKYKASLSRKDLEKFAQEITAFSPKTVTFSGGEPLLSPRWYHLARCFKERGVRVSVTTNGVYLLKNLTKVVRVLDQVSLSLGGPPSILHLIRENSFAHFKAIIEGLDALTLYKKKHANRPRLSVLYTLSDLSYAYMGEFIEFMRQAGIAVDNYHFQHLMFINQETLEMQKKFLREKFNITSLELWPGYTYSPGDIDFSRFIAEIKKVKKNRAVSFSPDLYPDEIIPYYKDNRGALHYRRYCTAPWHQVNLMPNGDIYICHDVFIGNIKERSFAEIWNGHQAQEVRALFARSLSPACKGCFYHYSERVK
ncbi:MAG: SPASM domain-containing protein [Candidatus Omnitrophota bacterium]